MIRHKTKHITKAGPESGFFVCCILYSPSPSLFSLTNVSIRSQYSHCCLSLISLLFLYQISLAAEGVGEGEATGVFCILKLIVCDRLVVGSTCLGSTAILYTLYIRYSWDSQSRKFWIYRANIRMFVEIDMDLRVSSWSSRASADSQLYENIRSCLNWSILLLATCKLIVFSGSPTWL